MLNGGDTLSIDLRTTMSLTSKQRSYLRGLANNMDPIIQIGKGGITANLLLQADEAL